jgi:hypothetical protein
VAFEVVAVRWHCFACEATSITRPGALPAGWFELPAPTWRAQHDPQHYCSEHAAEASEIHRRRRAKYTGRVHQVSVEEYELVKASVRHAAQLLDRLKFSGERAADRQL